MPDQEISEADVPLRWLLVGFVVTLFLVIGLVAFLYQPKPAETICANTEARCGDKPDASMQ